MKLVLLFLFVAGMASLLNLAQAQILYYAEATPVARYNEIPSSPYRHYEDVRRYNAAPNRFAYRGPEATICTTPQPVSRHGTCAPITKIRTEIVCQRNQLVASYDADGTKRTRTMTITMYKDIYSNGGARIWQHVDF